MQLWTYLFGNRGRNLTSLEADEKRLSKLLEVIEDLVVEISAERERLHCRYNELRSGNARLLDAMSRSNDTDSEGTSIDQLYRSRMRIEQLNRQLEFLQLTAFQYAADVEHSENNDARAA